MSLLVRRRAMMGAKHKPWSDTETTLQNFTKPSNTSIFEYNSTAKTLHIKSNGNRKWHSTWCNFTTASGYEYKLEYDLTYISGTHLGGARKSNNVMAADTGYIRESKHIKLLFQHDASINRIELFDTTATAQTGEMIYSNFSIQRRSI